MNPGTAEPQPKQRIETQSAQRLGSRSQRNANASVTSFELRVLWNKIFSENRILRLSRGSCCLWIAPGPFAGQRIARNHEAHPGALSRSHCEDRKILPGAPGARAGDDFVARDRYGSQRVHRPDQDGHRPHDRCFTRGQQRILRGRRAGVVARSRGAEDRVQGMHPAPQPLRRAHARGAASPVLRHRRGRFLGGEPV
jgi:hypothetical protein